MNHNYKKINEDKLFESFPKDRTVPGNWELEGLKPNRILETKSKGKDKSQDSHLKLKLDPFPQPRSFPDGWDI